MSNDSRFSKSNNSNIKTLSSMNSSIHHHPSSRSPHIFSTSIVQSMRSVACDWRRGVDGDDLRQTRDGGSCGRSGDSGDYLSRQSDDDVD